MKTIILNEKQISLFLNKLHEETVYMGNKEQIVNDYLNANFKAMEMDKMDDNGLPNKEKVVSILDTKKQITKNIITLKQLFYRIQERFKNILSDKKERDIFLWNTLNKWYK